MPLVNLRSVCYSADQTFKSKCSFCSTNFDYLQEKVSVNPEDLVVPPNFNRRLFENEADKKKLNRSLAKEKDYNSTKLSLYEILPCDYKGNFFGSTFAFQCHL